MAKDFFMRVGFEVRRNSRKDFGKNIDFFGYLVVFIVWFMSSGNECQNLPIN